MERGVVPGPQGSRWHAGCLICGGQEAKGRRKEEGKPGCGKKLDSGAKTDKDGGVWCRECLVSHIIYNDCRALVLTMSWRRSAHSSSHSSRLALADAQYAPRAVVHWQQECLWQRRPAEYRHNDPRSSVHRRHRRFGPRTLEAAHRWRAQPDAPVDIEPYEDV